jgi:hypothetical protein
MVIKKINRDKNSIKESILEVSNIRQPLNYCLPEREGVEAKTSQFIIRLCLVIKTVQA